MTIAGLVVYLVLVYFYIGYVCRMVSDDKNHIFAWVLLWPIIVVVKCIAELIDIVKHITKGDK